LHLVLSSGYRADESDEEPGAGWSATAPPAVDNCFAWPSTKVGSSWKSSWQPRAHVVSCAFGRDGWNRRSPAPNWIYWASG